MLIYTILDPLCLKLRPDYSQVLYSSILFLKVLLRPLHDQERLSNDLPRVITVGNDSL